MTRQQTNLVLYLRSKELALIVTNTVRPNHVKARKVKDAPIRNFREIQHACASHVTQEMLRLTDEVGALHLKSRYSARILLIGWIPRNSTTGV